MIFYEDINIFHHFRIKNMNKEVLQTTTGIPYKYINIGPRSSLCPRVSCMKNCIEKNITM